MDAENKQKVELGPAISIVVLLVLLAVVGLFFYKTLSHTGQRDNVVTTKVEIQAPVEIPELDTPQQIEVLETQLEEITVEIEEGDFFGLDELDAQLVELDELDAILDFEL